MKFSSIELQKAFEQAQPVLENITQTKNLISDEIKSLEKFLQSQSIAENFKFQLTSPYYHSNLSVTDDELIANEELLIWDAEKKRIIYQHNQYKSESFEDGIISVDNETQEIVLSRPLIETSFDIRKKVYECHLSKFLFEMTEKYKIITKNIQNGPF